MKYIATFALMLSFGVTGAYAHRQGRENDNLGNVCDQRDKFAAARYKQRRGSFRRNRNLRWLHLHMVRAVASSPDSSVNCPGATQIHFVEPAGAGVFRFKDGSLLQVNLTQGGDCIDFVALEAYCTITFQITGGTGRFKGATGVLTFTETVKPVLADALGNPVFFAATGDFTGTVSCAERDEDDHDVQQ